MIKKIFLMTTLGLFITMPAWAVKICPVTIGGEISVEGYCVDNLDFTNYDSDMSGTFEGSFDTGEEFVGLPVMLFYTGESTGMGFGDNAEQTRQRVRITAKGGLAPTVCWFSMLEKGWRIWNSADADETITGNNGILDATEVRQAYVKVTEVCDMIDLTIGRQFIGESTDLCLYDAADAIKADIATPLADITIFGETVNNNIINANGYVQGTLTYGVGTSTIINPATEPITTPDPVGPVNLNQDVNKYGLIISTDQIVPGQTLKGYIYSLSGANGSGIAQIGEDAHPEISLLTIGGKIGGPLLIDNLTYSAEIALQNGTSDDAAPDGEDLNIDGTGIEIGMNYATSIIDAATLNFRFGYGYGSGGEVDANGLYTSRGFLRTNAGSGYDDNYGLITKYAAQFNAGGLGLSQQIVGIQELSVLNLGVTLVPNSVKSLSLTVDWCKFTDNNSYEIDEISNDLGTELDMKITYTHNSNVSFSLAGGIFMPGDQWKGKYDVLTNPQDVTDPLGNTYEVPAYSIKTGTGVDNAMLLQATMKVTF